MNSPDACSEGIVREMSTTTDALGAHLLGVALGVVRAAHVAAAPVGVAREDLVPGRRDEVLHHRAAVEDVRVRGHEPRAEVLARVHERLEDVVVLPVGVLDVGELRIASAEDVGLVAADVDDVLPGEAGGAERLEDPLEHRPAHHVDERLRQLIGLMLEPAAAAGTDENGSHDAHTSTGPGPAPQPCSS